MIEVTGCYSVPFSEAKGDPEMNTSFNNDMFEAIRKAQNAGVPVGW